MLEGCVILISFYIFNEEFHKNNYVENHVVDAANNDDTDDTDDTIIL